MKSHFFKVGLRLAVFQLALLLCQTGRGGVPVFTVTPTSASNTYTGAITLNVTGLTSGETVIIEQYLDANSNGVVDAADFLLQYFRLTDGSNSVISGVTNINVPGDMDGTANGQITSKLNSQNNFMQEIVGKYVFRLSSPSNNFTSITESFAITNVPYGQQFSGTVQTNGVGLPHAVVILFQPPTGSDNGLNPIGGTVADSTGNYAIQAPAGTYALAAFNTNYVADTSAATNLVLGAGTNFNTNLSLIAATENISGQVVDANNATNGVPGLLIAVQSANSLLTLCTTGSNGIFTAPVTASTWKVNTLSSALAVHGYVGSQNKVSENVTSSNITNVTIAVPEATALFYGTVTDSFGKLLPGVVAIQASDSIVNGNGNGTYESDGYTDTNGNYVAAAVGGLGNSDTWQVQVDNSSSYPNYNFSQPDFDQDGGTNIGVGQAVQANITATLAPYTISGFLMDANSNGIAGVDIDVSTTNNNNGPSGTTDSNGFYLIDVSSGTWTVSVNSCSDCGGGSLPDNYFPPANQTVVVTNNVTVNFIAITATNTISGHLTDGYGHGITNVSIDVYTSDSNNYNVNGNTDSNGFYSILVINETWSVSINTCINCGGGNYLPTNYVVPSNQSQTVVISNNSAVVDFVAPPISNSISGFLTDANGNGIPSIGVYAYIPNGYNQSASTASNGFYSIGVINGSWTVGVTPCTNCGPGNPLPSNYLPPANENVTVVIFNNSPTVNFNALSVTTFLNGQVVDDHGSPVTNMNVFAGPSGGGNSFQATTDGSGNYQMGVTAGNYNVSLNNDPNSGYPSLGLVGPNVPVSITNGITVNNFDLVAKRVTGAIQVQVNGSQNIGVSNIGVSANFTDGITNYSAGPAQTGNSGAALVPVCNGTNWQVSLNNNDVQNAGYPAPSSQFATILNNTNTLTFNLASGSSPSFTVSVLAAPSSGGAVFGNGTFASNSSVTVTATVSNGYAFTDWTLSGQSVSTETSYTFTLTSNVSLLANFTLAAPLIQVSYGTNPPIAITNGQSNAVYFGGIQQGQDSPAITFTLTNSGGQTLDVGTPTVPAGFGLFTNPSNSVAPGNITTFIVTLSNTTVGSFSGNIVFTNNASNTPSPFSFPVTGSVATAAPEFVLLQGANNVSSNQTVSFGSIEQGMTGPTNTFTVTNPGTLTLYVGTPALPAGYILLTASLTNNTPIAPGSNFTFTVQLSTTNPGAFNGQLSITNNDTNNNPFVFNLNGNVVALPQILVYSIYDGATNVLTNNQTVSFGSVQQGSNGPVVTFAVTNAGGEPLVLGLQSPGVPSGYQLTANVTNIISSNIGIFSVQLTASNTGTFTGDITITNNSTNSPFVIMVTGTVLPGPAIQVTPNPANFGSVQQGSNGTSITFTITNAGGETLTVGEGILAPSGYTITTFPPSSIAPGSNGVFSVQLTTAAAGTFSGNIGIFNNTTNSPYLIGVSGFVLLPPEIQVFEGATAITNGQTNAANEVSFGTVQQNLTGPTVTFTVTNGGGEPLALQTPGVPAGYLLATNLTNTIAPGGNGTFTVQMTNTAAVGTNAGNISVTNNSTNSPFVFAITGTVAPPPQMLVLNGSAIVTNGQTNAISFGSVEQGSTGPTMTFTVTNAGTGPLTLATPGLPSGFALTTAPPGTIAAGASGAFVVQLTTASVGGVQGNITLTNNDPTNNPFVFAVAGTVLAPPQIQVLLGTSPIAGLVNFGSVQQGSNGPVTVFTVTNAGGVPLTVATPVMPAGYSLIANVTNSIAPNGSGTFSVQLDSNNVGTFPGNITLVNNSTNSPFVIAVTGMVTSPGPEIQVWQGTNLITDNQTNAVIFGVNLQNQTGTNVTFTVSNIGGLTLSLSNVAVPSGYTVTTNLTNSIPPGSSGAFAVQLDTAAVGAFSGSITITNGDISHTPFSFPISGLVNGAVISLSGSLDFGVLPFNTTGSHPLIISNAGNINLTVSNITSPNNFTITPLITAPVIITPGSTQTFMVTFAPTAAINYSGLVTVFSDSSSGSSNVPVTAFGANPPAGAGWLLTIVTNPVASGTVTPNDAKVIKAGTKVSLKAVAKDKSIVFVNWTGSYNTYSNPLTFKMTSDTIVQANFTNNPFPQFVGIYNGLFWASNDITVTGAGMLKGLTVTSDGTYSGSLLVNGASKNVSGSFTPDFLLASNAVTVDSAEGTVDLTMILTSNDVGPIVTGTVSNSTLNLEATNLLAYRAANSLHPSPEYTLAIWPDTNVTASPAGYGYASILASAGSVKTGATATIAGALADGTTYSQSTSISQDSYVPVYASLYGGKGVLLGFINLTNMTGPLYWFHPQMAANSSTSVKGLFTSTNQIELGPWDSSDIFGATATLNGTDIASNTIEIGSNGKITGTAVTGSSSITSKTGVFSVTIGTGSSKVTGHGVILTGTNTTGYGYFENKSTNGAIIIQP